MNKPKQKRSDPYWDYSEVIRYIEWKYNISTRGYVPKGGFTEDQFEKASIAGADAKPYLDFWHYVTEFNDIHNGSFFYLNLLGDYEEGREEDDGDWDGDDEYRPRWVREIQKMIYDEFKPEGGEMYCYTSW